MSFGNEQPKENEAISGNTMNVDYSAFEGWEIKGRPSAFAGEDGARRLVGLGSVRGEIAAKDGKFVGKVGRGKLVKREPTHF